MSNYHWWHRLTQSLRPVPRWPTIQCPQGSHSFILVGSIHMGVAAMAPLPSSLRKQLQQCDGLVVEADITQPPDDKLWRTSPRAPLEQRFSAHLQQQLAICSKECQLDPSIFTHLPAWQIGLTLQQQQAHLLGLRPEFGIDYQLITAATALNKPVMTLETPEQQLRFLTELPQDGLSLLEDSLTHWRTNARLLQKMIDWWISGYHRVTSPRPELPLNFNSELQQRLIDQRNQQWCEHLLSLPPGQYLVAVGALHLVGPTSLAHLLTATHSKD